MHRGAKIFIATTMLVGGVSAAIVFRKPPPGPRVEAVEESPPTRREATKAVEPLAVQQPALVVQQPLVVAAVPPRVTLEWPAELGPEATLGVPCELPPEEVTSHKVRDGETLSALARKYLGSPDRFKELLEANRDVVPNEKRLRVGVVLRIPRGGATPPAPSGAAPMVPIDKGQWRKAEPGQRGL
jgi:nucleoid-associated protein YgaU